MITINIGEMKANGLNIDIDESEGKVYIENHTRHPKEFVAILKDYELEDRDIEDMVHKLVDVTNIAMLKKYIS